MNNNTSLSVPGEEIKMIYSPGYLILSFCICFLGSGVSLDLMSRRTKTTGLINHAILLISSVFFGVCSIFTLHFIAISSVTFQTQNGTILDVYYDPYLTMASLLCAVIGIWVAFYAIGDPNLQTLRNTRFRIAACATFVSLSVLLMHHLGVGSLYLQGTREFIIGWIAFQCIIGWITAAAALYIFFEKSRIYLGTPKWRLFWFFSSAIMSGFVLLVHSLGLVGMRFYYDPNPLSDAIKSLPTSDSLKVGTGVSVPCISVVTLLIMKWMNYRYIKREAAKAQSLILSMVMFDNRGYVLSSLVSSSCVLPNVSIETEYNGKQAFENTNPDFKRMFKTSFNWHEVNEMRQRVQQSYEQRDISLYSFMLYEKFILAGEQMAKKFSISISELDILYWNPAKSMVTMVMKSKQGSQLGFETAFNEPMKWVKPTELVGFLSGKLNAEQDPVEWITHLKEYYDRCYMPMTGEYSFDRLKETLRKVATEDLKLEKEDVEPEVQEWIKILNPRYVRNLQTLITLVQSPEEYKEILLPPPVKAVLRKFIERLTNVNLPNQVSGSGSVAELMNRNLNEDTVSSLYMGIYYVQATNSGFRVLLRQQGPYRIVPMVKFGRQQGFTSENIAWLKSLCEQPDLFTFPLTKLSQRRVSRSYNNININNPTTNNPKTAINSGATTARSSVNINTKEGPLPHTKPGSISINNEIVSTKQFTRPQRLTRRSWSQKDIKIINNNTNNPLSSPPPGTPKTTESPATTLNSPNIVHRASLPEGEILYNSTDPLLVKTNRATFTNNKRHTKGNSLSNNSKVPFIQFMEQETLLSARKEDSKEQEEESSVEGKEQGTSVLTTNKTNLPHSLPSFLSSTTTNPTNPTSTTTSNNFIMDFIQGCSQLEKLLGTDKHLTPQHLDGVHILPIASDINLLLFVVVEFSTSMIFPQDYSSQSLLFVPLSTFETIHFSQENNRRVTAKENTTNINNNSNSSTSTNTGTTALNEKGSGNETNNNNTTSSSSGSMNWTQNLIRNQINKTTQNTVIRAPIINATNDVIFSNPIRIIHEVPLPPSSARERTSPLVSTEGNVGLLGNEKQKISFSGKLPTPPLQKEEKKQQQEEVAVVSSGKNKRIFNLNINREGTNSTGRIRSPSFDQGMAALLSKEKEGNSTNIINPTSVNQIVPLTLNLTPRRHSVTTNTG